MIDTGHSPGALRFEILGPLRVWRGDAEVDAGPRQQRCLLALLLAAAGEPLGVGDLVDLIWESEPPPTAVNVIHKYVGSLRRIFEPGLPARSSGSQLLRYGNGYRMAPDTVTVDVMAFRRHLAAAQATTRAAARSGAVPDAALGHYIRALGMVRGPAGGDLPETARASGVFAGFDGQFFDAAVAAGTIAVRLGRPAEVLPALRLAATMDPLHEPVHAALVTALAAADRQADALTAYRAISERLGTELGVDPGPALRQAQRLVLTQSAGPAADPAPPVTPHPAQLPPDLPVFTGRETELAALTGLVAGVGAAGRTGPVVVALDGMGGVGKSTLAVHFAHLVSGRFPDGLLHLDLHGDRDEPDPPAEAVRSLLYALGVHASHVPDTFNARVGMYRGLTAGKRLLVLLDNARDPGQVRPLLPNSPGSAVLVTSRRPLLGLAAFDGAHLMPVDLPDLPEARRLLARRLTGVPNRPLDDAADEMIELCGRLPLALAIVGARLSVRRQLSHVAAELRDGARRLSALSVGAGDHDPRTSFAWSYRQLSPGAARLFRYLSVALPTGVRVAPGAALSGQDAGRTGRELAELAEAALVTGHEDGRFTAHVLVRAYAGELFRATEPEPERRAAVTRLLEFYLHSAYHANAQVYPHHTPAPQPLTPGVVPDRPASHAAAMAWFADRRTVLKEAVRAAAGPGSGIRPWQLASVMQQYLLNGGFYQDWEEVARIALTAARRDHDEVGEAHALRALAGARNARGAHEEALGILTAAQRIVERRDMRAEQALIHSNLQWVYEELGRHQRALTHGEAALAIYRADGNDRDLARGLLFNGRSLTRLGRLTESSRVLEEALALLRRAGGAPDARMVIMEGAARKAVAANLARSGRPGDAVRQLELAAEAVRDHLPETMDTLTELAGLLITEGDTERAREVLDRIRALLASFPDGAPEYLRAGVDRLAASVAGQHRVHRGDGARTFTDRGCHPLVRARA